MAQTPTKTNNVPTQPQNKGSKIWIVLALLFLIVAIGVLIYFMPKIGEYQKLVEEKEQEKLLIQYELDDLMKAHDSIKMEYGTLADSLAVKDSIIQANAKEIKELLNYKWEYRKANKKLTLLREIAQGYVHQMDSLYTVNKELKEENEKIRQQYAREQDRTRDLTKDKEELMEKIDQATALNAFNISATTERFTGSGRARDTDKASKVERVQVCFTLGENKLIDPGLKKVYIRIVRPDGVVVTQKVDGPYTFEFEGATLEYTASKDVEYKNEETPVCLHWNKKSKEVPAMVGVYKVAIYTETYEIGNTTFELR
jgi:hypothetical protein